MSTGMKLLLNCSKAQVRITYKNSFKKSSTSIQVVTHRSCHNLKLGEKKRFLHNFITEGSNKHARSKHISVRTLKISDRDFDFE